MELSYTSTLDDAVGVSIELFNRSSGGRDLQARDRRQLVIVVAISSALYPAFSIYRQGGIAELGAGRLWTAIGLVVVLTAAVFATHGVWFRWLQRNRMRKLLERQHGPGPYPCTLRLNPEGVAVAQEGITFEFPWREAEGLDEAPDWIRIWFRVGAVHVPDGAFDSAEARDQFVGVVQQYIAAADESA